VENRKIPQQRGDFATYEAHRGESSELSGLPNLDLVVHARHELTHAYARGSAADSEVKRIGVGECLT